MTRGEFIKSPRDFGSSQNPLDDNLVRMQATLRERMKTECPKDGVPFHPITVKYTSEDPLREYGDITVEICECEHSKEEAKYDVKITVANKQGDYSITELLYRDSWDALQETICSEVDAGTEKWDFFRLCKARVLWLDHQARIDMEPLRLQVIEEGWVMEYEGTFDILICIDTGRKPNQWPANELEQAFPVSNILAPDIPYVGREASDMMNKILRDLPFINVVVTGVSNEYIKFDLFSFNVITIKPLHPLSELGEYVFSEGKGLKIYWRKDSTLLRQSHDLERLRVIASMILDNRIEQYRHERGEYEKVPDAAVLLYSMLAPKIPNTGKWDNEIEGVLPVSVANKDLQLVMTIKPYYNGEIDLKIVLRHPLIRDQISFHKNETPENLSKIITSRNAKYEIYSSVEWLMDRWPTPHEIKMNEAKLLDVDEFYVTPEDEAQIVRLHKNCVLHIEGHTFHGIDEVMAWKGDTPTILKKNKLFPCFDSYDYASENRFYRNYLICRDEEDAKNKRAEFDAIPRDYGCVIGRDYPEHLRPLVYYSDESNEMTLMY